MNFLKNRVQELSNVFHFYSNIEVFRISMCEFLQRELVYLDF